MDTLEGTIAATSTTATAATANKNTFSPLFEMIRARMLDRHRTPDAQARAVAETTYLLSRARARIPQNDSVDVVGLDFGSSMAPQPTDSVDLFRMVLYTLEAESLEKEVVDPPETPITLKGHADLIDLTDCILEDLIDLSNDFPEINMMDVDSGEPPNKDYTKMKRIVVDSGAAESAMDPEDAPGHAIQPTTRMGYYVGPCGERIPKQD